MSEAARSGSRPGAKRDTRAQIIRATRQVVRRQGVANATTKAIAQAAGCSEGSIYNHFPDKRALVTIALSEQSPQFLELVRGLPGRAGSGTVEATLVELLTSGLDFFERVLPMLSGAFAERQLLSAQRRQYAASGEGPRVVVKAIADYLCAEQRLGRVSRSAQPGVVAHLLLGAIFHYAFLKQMIGGEGLQAAASTLPKDVVAAVLGGVGGAARRTRLVAPSRGFA